jgi:release factor glutamine methyltransferase
MASARGQGLERLDAQLLLGHVLGRDRAWLLAHEDEPLQPGQAAQWAALCARRLAGEPVAYLLGDKEFYGLTLRVTPDTLVPRPDTEILVDAALAWLQDRPAPRVLDLGTGSGAIALALKHACPRAEVHALEAQAAALQVARDNARRLGLDVHWHFNDLDLCCAGQRWWAGLAGQCFDLVVSNPPYVAQGDPHLTALRHEPLTALVAGPTGLEDLRQIVAGAREHLLPHGALMLEHGFDQSQSVQGFLREYGFTNIHSKADLAGHLRCTIAELGPTGRPGEAAAGV